MQIIFDLIILYILIYFTFKWCINIIHQFAYAQESSYVKGILFWGLAVKILVIAAWYIVADGHEFNPSVVDASRYDSIGIYISDALHNFVLPNLFGWEKVGFAYIVGILYTVFGQYNIVISLFNALLSIWTAMMIFEITYRISKNAQAGIYAYIAAMFYPHFISASYLLLKDMTATFLLIALVWSLYCVKKTQTKLIFLSLVLFVLAYIRIQIAVIAVLLILLTVLFRRELIFEQWAIKNKFINYTIAIFMIVGLGFVLSNIQMEGVNFEESGYTLPATDQGGLMPHEDVRLTLSGKGFVDVIIYLATSPVLLIQSLIVSFIRIFYGPFFLYAAEGMNLTPYAPNEVGFRAVLESLGGLYTGLILPYIIWGFVYFIKNHRQDLLIWCFPVIWVFVMTLSSPIIRWRLPMMSFTFILFGMGFQYSAKFNRLYPIYFIILIFALAFNASRLENVFLVGALFVAFTAVITLQLLVLKNR